MQKATFSSPYGHAINNSCELNNCGEANLDVQTIMSIAPNVSSIFWYNEDDSFLSYVLALANLTESLIPDVTTISYAQYEDHLTQEFVDSFNTEMIKLGLMGKTILCSSGDDGVGGFTTRYNFAYCGYRPYFPGSSPYVLVVGGTQGPESGKQEITCQSNKGGDITSGGGFSNKNERPYYQNDVVLEYLSKVKPFPGFNSAGRAYPDISALAFNFTGVYGGNVSFQSGTSASTPLVAGLISLLNSERQSKGMPLVGFINPLLYKYYSYFAIDITEGFNNCCVKGFVCCQQGFEATVGYDAATGLGSINFKNLTAIAMNVSTLSLPTTSPTVAPPPTYKPTSFPTSTSSVKMAMFYYYDGYGCGNSSTINHVTGVITGRCVPKDNFYVMYECGMKYNALALTYSSFNDSSCQYLLSNQSTDYDDTTYSIYYGCSNMTTSTDEFSFSIQQDYSVNMSCVSLDLDNNFPNAVSNVLPNTKTYNLQLNFDSSLTECESSGFISFNAYENGYCFNGVVYYLALTSVLGQGMYPNNPGSYQYLAGTKMGFTSLNCTGQFTSSNLLSSGCFENSNFDDADTSYSSYMLPPNLFSQWQLMKGQAYSPTTNPTNAPTNTPTSITPTASTQSSNHNISTIGISLGVMAAVIVLCGIARYYYYKKFITKKASDDIISNDIHSPLQHRGNVNRIEV